MDAVRKAEVMLSAALGVAFLGYLVAIFYFDIPTEVVNERFWKNVVPLFDGEIPIMEYPPFALVFFIVPRLFASTPDGYNVAYVVFVYIFTLIGLDLMRRIAERYGKDPIGVMVVYSVLMALLLQFLADRYDIFPAVMTIAAFYLFVTKRPYWAMVILALAMLTKLYPAILVPFLLWVLFARRERKVLIGSILAFVAATLAVVVPLMVLEPELITNFLHYHIQRPLEVGSVPATLVYPLSMLGISDMWILDVAHSGFGSDDLVGPIPDALAPWVTPLMVAGIVFVLLFYGHLRHRAERADERFFLLTASILSALLVFMVVGKVFSSQYLIWAVPFYVMVMMSTQNRTFKTRLKWLTIASFILTQINFAYIYGYLGGGTDINDLAMILMLIRNLMVVGTLILTMKEMWDLGKNGYEDEELGTSYSC